MNISDWIQLSVTTFFSTGIFLLLIRNSGQVARLETKIKFYERDLIAFENNQSSFEESLDKLDDYKYKARRALELAEENKKKIDILERR